jgi:hypothetical protein
MISIRELNDIELTEVSGGKMTCDQAFTMAEILMACVTGLTIAGRSASAHYFTGVAQGALEGACN